MRPSLVIFDCDGVLVDTEPTSNAVMVEILRAEGLEIDIKGSMARFLGKSMASVQTDVEAEIGRKLAPDWSESVREATIEALEQNGVDPVPGIGSAINAIDHAGIQICVASSGSISKMHVSLGSSGLLDRLRDVLFTADSVSRGKPAPDLFLHAANQMGHDPRTCVVIEDSRVGVQAALAAGMRALAFTGAPNAQPQDMIEMGAEVFGKMADLPKMLHLEVTP